MRVLIGGAVSCLQALAQALATAQIENNRARARKVMIEKRKEDAERQAAALEQQEEHDRLMQERISAAAEEERRKQERWVAHPFQPQPERTMSLSGGARSGR